MTFAFEMTMSAWSPNPNDGHPTVSATRRAQ
jgi:hypothetical protein